MSDQPQEEEYYSIIEPLGDSASVCGYCHSSSDSSHAYGLWAHNLSPKVYQLLMDRGWRRSGSYLYLPDRRSSCCPPYTIRCSASDFKPSRSQRQAVYRWRKFILNSQEQNLNHHKTSSKFDLSHLFDFSDLAHQDPTSNTSTHSFKIRLEPAKFTQEKFELYKKYQTEVHGDRAEEVTTKSFERFLCTNPFRSDDTVAKHACWLVDDKMIAFSVIDILPCGISSVYLVWDTNYAKHGLGRLASLREIAWIQEWKDTLKFSLQFNWYYLGFYIHSCPKMAYKGEYSPSFLLDPTMLDWKPLESCIPSLEQSTTNVTTFASGLAGHEDAQKRDASPADFLVSILTPSGAIETIRSSDPRVSKVVEKIGCEVAKLSLICV